MDDKHNESTKMCLINGADGVAMAHDVHQRVRANHDRANKTGIPSKHVKAY